MIRPLPLKDRIRAALVDGPKSYYQVMREVFPEEQFPRAFQQSSNGGPPGCAMAFGRALREMGINSYRANGPGHGELRLPR